MRLRTLFRARLLSTVVVAAGAAATLGSARTSAVAEGFYFWESDRPVRAAPPPEYGRAAQPQRPAARKKISRPARKKSGASAAREAKPETAHLDRPLFAVASIADQRISIYNHHGLVARSAISTGVPGHSTPKGIFTIIGRERFHRSNIYSGAPMPFMQRITWSGIAMHLGVVPGHPASHGCIRLPAAFASKLWGMTRIGERVVISGQDVIPTEFEHPLLPAPKMRAESDTGEPPADSRQRPLNADHPSIPPQRRTEPPQAVAGAEAAGAEKAAPAAVPRPSVPDVESTHAADLQPAEQSGAVAEAEIAASPDEDVPPPGLDAAAAPALDPQPSEASRIVAADAAPVDAATPDKAQPSPVDPQLPALDDAPTLAADPPAEQPKTKAEATQAKMPESKIDTPPSPVERPSLNPHQYAQRLKAKAAAEAAAAGKAVKALSAEVGSKRQEAARAATQLRAAERLQAAAQEKADAAAASYDRAAIAAASQKEAAETAERGALLGDAPAKAKADRLTRAYGKALLAQDAASLAKTNADAALADATANLEQARTASAAKDEELADADRRLDDAKNTADVAATAVRDAQRRVAPVSVLISKKDRRIYVRQGLSALFDAPIEIRDPDAPLGSHLYIATAASDDGRSLKWSVLSMPVSGEAQRERRKNVASAESKADVSWRWSPAGESPSEALERVDIPQEVRDRIAERLWTGASLIISDQPVSGETGNDGTDLTIKFR